MHGLTFKIIILYLSLKHIYKNINVFFSVMWKFILQNLLYSIHFLYLTFDFAYKTKKNVFQLFVYIWIDLVIYDWKSFFELSFKFSHLFKLLCYKIFLVNTFIILQPLFSILFTLNQNFLLLFDSIYFKTLNIIKPKILDTSFLKKIINNSKYFINNQQYNYLFNEDFLVLIL